MTQSTPRSALARRPRTGDAIDQLEAAIAPESSAGSTAPAAPAAAAPVAPPPAGAAPSAPPAPVRPSGAAGGRSGGSPRQLLVQINTRIPVELDDALNEAVASGAWPSKQALITAALERQVGR